MGVYTEGLTILYWGDLIIGMAWALVNIMVGLLYLGAYIGCALIDWPYK
jgi:hypothetical protein